MLQIVSCHKQLLKLEIKIHFGITLLRANAQGTINKTANNLSSQRFQLVTRYPMATLLQVPSWKDHC